MAAARLSPAASLLRNSRLFALPPQIPLPPTEPSSEPVTQSDTATTPYPVLAAIETPTSSLMRGDWGLKRSLPVQTTTKTSTPVIRIRRGIDTQEHIADFESAADHVLTLRKYQELGLRVTLPSGKEKKTSLRTSAFDSEVDNTSDASLTAIDKKNAASSWLDWTASERATRLPQHLRDTIEELRKEKVAHGAADGDNVAPIPPPEPVQPVSSLSPQATRRWRYSGPYLAGMNGMEFDSFLKNITRDQRAAFRKFVKNHIAVERAEQQRAEALAQGETGRYDHAADVISEEDVETYLRQMRSEPGKFGPLIAEFFDLADGPKPPAITPDPWTYGRDTISAELYRESGPPRTHPSAGLSYTKTEMFSENDIMVGPRETRRPVPGRLLKSIAIAHNRNLPYTGVAGFVVPQPSHTSLTEYNWKWSPRKDGPKMVLTPLVATVSQAGKVEIQTRLQPTWRLEGEVPVDNAEKPLPKNSSVTPRTRSAQLPNLDRTGPRGRSARSRPAPEPSQDISAELEAMMQAAYKHKARKTG